MMNLLRISLVILGMLLYVSTGYSQEKKDTMRLSVADAQKYALEYNRTLRSAKMDIEIAKKKVWETTAIGLPQFSVTGNYQHLFNVPEFGFPLGGLSPTRLPDMEGLTQTQIGSTGAYSYELTTPKIKVAEPDNLTYNFSLTQLIFSGEYIVGLQASKAYRALSEKSAAKAEQSTTESVATGYYTVLILDENIRVLRESFNLVDKTYSELSAMNKQGFVEVTDVDQMKINRSNIQTMINSLSNQKEVAVKLLKLQLGMDFSQPVVLTDSLSGIIDRGNGQYLSSSEFDVNNNVDYQLASTNEKLMSLSWRRQKSTFLPTVSGFYQHQDYLKQPEINFQPKDVAGIAVSIPIITSGSRVSKVGQARLDYEKAKLAKADAEQGLIMQFDQAKNDYLTAFSNFNTNKESMNLSQQIYNRTLIKYREGMASSIDLTQNQNQFLTSQSNYYNALLTLLNAQAKLERMLTKYEQK